MATKTDSKPTVRTIDRLLPIFLIISVIALAVSFWAFWQSKQKLSVLTNPDQASELNAEQTAQLLEKVKLLAVLPNEPTPVVATINDVETLASRQAFYKDAHNGDKLIVFARSRKAIIFDEKNNRIVNIGPIFYTDAEGNNQTTPLSQEGKLNIDLRNGSNTKDKGVTMRDKLMPNGSFVISKLAKAANSNYSGITLVDLVAGDAKNDLIQALAKELGAVTITQQVPDGETAPNAEVLVILGN